MLLRTTSIPEALDQPGLSGDKIRRRWVKDGLPGVTRDIPMASVRDLQVKYGPERGYAPHLREATFTVPLGTTWTTYERVRDEMVGKWLTIEQKKGWDALLDSQHRLRVEPYIYPAHDLSTGTFDLGSRQFVVKAWFTFRNPTVQRLELDTDLQALLR